MFVFTRDPSSLGFNSSSHILLGLQLGEAEEVSVIRTKFDGRHHSGDFNLQTQNGHSSRVDAWVIFGYSLLVSRIGRTKKPTARKIQDREKGL